MTIEVDIGEVQKLQTEVYRAQTALDHGLKLVGEASSTVGKLGAPQSQWTGHNFTIGFAPTTPFGNTFEGGSCNSAHSGAFTAATATLKAFAATVDSDAERLKLALALYKSMDAKSAEQLLRLNRNALDVYSAHMSTGGEWAGLQAGQIDRLRALIGGPNQGNTVIGGDFNAASGGNDPSAQAIRRFADQGVDPYAGVIHDGPNGAPVGTSANHYPIDHVLPRGIGASEAQRWARDESDHDGQRVDVTLPAW
ncbi:endonuclease/exonuclease/phosphatase family protein [Nocardia sp. NPDC049149]|uniref:endonuclease/exonuclease/phosphatase family protein n=1 Tax=Nocardia sp. NPDC049149 TaxID=3364315 RepID=UPI00371AEDB4